MFVCKLPVRSGAVLTDTDHHHVLVLKILISSSKRTGLPGAAGGVVLRIKIEHYFFAPKTG
ncbi:hypothetical protein SDC9_173472 [bioreactor metagenome]|uniref:Uncharacterized protein n=1 Tax=bioreactor metagenome TaxID=1076179 RepID=A0A645GIT5_9ZZZZ